MTEIHDGEVVEARLPGGVAVVDVGPPVMGPPGLRGQRGERGDPGGTTVVVYSFGDGGRTPAELPPDGLIPAGWDGPRAPASAIQLAVGQSAEYRPDGYLWLYLGPNAIEGGWIETGQLRGPPGDQGPIGDTGPTGPPGERGLTGQAGTPGPKGDRGDVGPQGARGEIGQTGPPGATGVPGPKGDRGDTGPTGLQGDTGPTGARGPEGPTGPRGDPGPEGPIGETGEPGGPTFIVGSFTTRTAADLATAAPTGLIPANFDGAQRPPAAVQLAPGEAWLDDNSADGTFYRQAITFLGTASTPPFAHWIGVVVRGDKGDRGDVGPTGAQGPEGAQGPAGDRGGIWHWSPFNPPTVDTIGPHAPGDMVLCLLPGGTGTTPGHGDVYHVVSVGVFGYDGSIKGPAGPAGPQGPPGEVTQAQHDSLALRVTRLETVAAQTLSGDVVMADNADTIIQSVPLGIGDHVAQGTFTFELDKGADVTASSRVVTMWVEASGPVVLTGQRAGQLYLHQALPLGSLSFGPMRALVSGPGNAVVYYRVSRPPGDEGPQSGRVIAKATTTIGAKPGASGFVSR